MDGIGVAVFGAGYWGRNLVRTLHRLPEAHLRLVCDPDPEAREEMETNYPGVHAVADSADVWGELEKGDTDGAPLAAVAIATPSVTHAEMASEALRRGLHCFVEKPLAGSRAEAEALVAQAEEAGKVLMVGHLLAYHPGLLKVKELIDEGELGEVLYLYSQRLNLGRIRKTENALWSLAPHDISTILLLIEEEPHEIIALGGTFVQPDVEDVVFVGMRFPSGKMAHIQVSWLDPHRVRRLTVVGKEKMIVFDDADPTEKVRIYAKRAEPAEYQSYGDAIGVRFGDVHIPRIEMAEPLRLEMHHFLECVREGGTPRTDGREGARVLRVLEAASRSLEAGRPVALGERDAEAP